jgi:hypothetical protein
MKELELAMLHNFEKLDRIVVEVANGREDAFGRLSSGEAVYVALVAGRVDLLTVMGYTIPQALNRLDDGWIEEMILRWRYSNPKAGR